MKEIICCPDCNSDNIIRYGHTRHGKQNHQCKDCKREFVLNPGNKLITGTEKDQIKKLLLERISLRGICRVMSVSLTWLLGFIGLIYKELPDHLNLQISENNDGVFIFSIESEVDEMWSFVGNKKNKKWIWIAMDAKTKQIIAFHVGGRTKADAQILWDKLPEFYQKNSIFYTDLYDSYEGVIPAEQHKPVIKQTGRTNHIERFNCTLRQRVSRLVRKTLSFSKILKNHIGAIKYFICNYNLTKVQIA